MQRPQPDDENITESSVNLANAPDEEFAEDKQTAGIVDEAEMEFVQTQYSPRGAVLMYFRGDSAAEVERHFNRTFSELCCLPGSGTSANSMEGSHCQGRTTIPMSQRNFPVSFWNPSQPNHSQHLQTGFSRHGNSINVFQQNHNTTTHYNSSYSSTGHHGNFNHNGPNLVHTRTIPVSYAQLPPDTVKNLSPGLAPQMSARPCRAPAPSFPQESAVQNSDLHANSLRFNPNYNSLLVQPDVKPHLPHVPGEPPGTRAEGRSKDLEGFPAELLMRKGDN